MAPGHRAIILIGERNDGAVQGVTNPDNIQKRVREEAEKIYPDIIWRTVVYERDGKACVRVEIEHSGNTPHFGGPAWVRRGSESVKANDEMFQKLIDIRTSIVRELSGWINKEVTVEIRRLHMNTGKLDASRHNGYVKSVNSFYVTVEYNNLRESQPLKEVLLSWDDAAGRLAVILDRR